MVRSIIFFWRLYVVESASMYSFIQLLIMYILSQEIHYVLDGISFLMEHICTEDRKALKQVLFLLSPLLSVGHPGLLFSF